MTSPKSKGHEREAVMLLRAIRPVMLDGNTQRRLYDWYAADGEHIRRTLLREKRRKRSP